MYIPRISPHVKNVRRFTNYTKTHLLVARVQIVRHRYFVFSLVSYKQKAGDIIFYRGPHV